MRSIVFCILFIENTKNKFLFQQIIYCGEKDNWVTKGHKLNIESSTPKKLILNKKRKYDTLKEKKKAPHPLKYDSFLDRGRFQLTPTLSTLKHPF